MMPAKGLMIAAPSSGAGKTTVTLALLRALRNEGYCVRSAKSGPDYIDPAFHSAASGAACINLDAYAMDGAQIQSLSRQHCKGADVFLLEAAMGLFDGAANGGGSSADLAALLGLPVLLVIDCQKQAQSVAALVHGFASYRADVRIAGVLLNRVASPKHEAMLRMALAPLAIPIVGVIYRDSELGLPKRHLGLVQAGEHANLEAFLENAAKKITQQVDLQGLFGTSRPLAQAPVPAGANGILRPLGQRIAIARDVAFAFCYPHVLRSWQQQGAELSFFSPLANEAPNIAADAVFLPGGYPELHAGQLAGAHVFRQGMKRAAEQGVVVYGECGGYMCLGDTLVDKDGHAHAMLGLLPLQTSFQQRKLHLGYRQLHLCANNFLPWKRALMAHEFHYASTVGTGNAPALFTAQDATGAHLADMGLQRGRVAGSFAHVICEKTRKM